MTYAWSLSQSPLLTFFSLFDRAGLALPSRLLPGLPRKKEDPLTCGVRRAPTLWAQDEE